MGGLSEVLLPLPEPIPRMRHVRSTLLHGGLASITAAGLLDAYTAVAPVDVRTAIQSSVAGMWLPIDIAIRHYAAIDQLGIPADAAARMGRGTFDRTKGILLGTAVALARRSGVTPWTLVPHLQRFWLRGYDGGALRATKLGPKELRLDVLASPVLASRYYRNAARGLATGLFELVCRKAYGHEERGGTDTTMSLRIQWA
jgi:hypothetical protein